MISIVKRSQIYKSDEKNLYKDTCTNIVTIAKQYELC